MWLEIHNHEHVIIVYEHESHTVLLISSHFDKSHTLDFFPRFINLLSLIGLDDLQVSLNSENLWQFLPLDFFLSSSYNQKT